MRVLLCTALLIALAGCGKAPEPTATATSTPAPARTGEGLAIPLKQGMAFDAARAALAGAGWQHKERFAYVGSSGAGEDDPCKLDDLKNTGAALCAKYPEMQLCTEDMCEMRYLDPTGRELVVATSLVAPSAPAPLVQRWRLEAAPPVEMSPDDPNYVPPAEPAPVAAATPAPAAETDETYMPSEWVALCTRTLIKQIKSLSSTKADPPAPLVAARCECLARNGDPDDLGEMAWMWDSMARLDAGEITMPTDTAGAGAVLARMQAAGAAAKRAGATCD